MRRLFLALAVMAAATCGNNLTTPEPANAADGWGGSVTFSQTTNAGIVAATTWTGTVVWEDSGLVDLRTRATIFKVQSATVSATYLGTAPCPAEGSVASDKVTIDPQRDSSLVVQPDGTYSGSFHAIATIPVTTSNCPYPVVPPPTTDNTLFGLDLIISGKANGLSLQGNMIPVVDFPTTYTGSWIFGTLPPR